MFGICIDKSRDALFDACTAVYSRLKAPSSLKPRSSRTLRIGGLEARLLLSATPIAPDLLVSEATVDAVDAVPQVDAETSAVVVVTLVGNQNDGASDQSGAGIDPLRFDYGSANSPVEQDFVQIQPSSAYSTSAGYGWLSSPVYDATRSGGTAATVDLNYGSELIFAVDVPNGLYEVTVTTGDLGSFAHDQMGVFLEEMQVGTVSTAAGEVVTNQYGQVNVTDGQLTLRMTDLGGSDRNVVLNALEVVSVPDTSGPSVIGISPSGDVVYPVDHVTLTFGEAIEQSSFTAADVSLTGPGGLIAITGVSAVPGSGNQQFEVSFAGQRELGSYSLVVGPGIYDLAGIQMDQDGDGVAGELGQDEFVGGFTLVPFMGTFDFGAANSQVEQGYTQVLASSDYSASAGYGWINSSVYDAARSGGTALTADFNYGSELIFAVDLPDGMYDVTMTSGDLGPFAHDQMGVFLEDVQVDTVSTAAGEVVTMKYEQVNVSDGQLTLRLTDLGGSDRNVVLNALQIDPHVSPSSVVVSPPQPVPDPPSSSLNVHLRGKDLLVAGDAIGAVQIVALADGTFQVTDNGEVVATVDGVERSVRVELGSADDDVTLDLQHGRLRGNAVIDLGDGNNSFTVMSGSIGGHLIVRGADGDDSVAIQSDVSIGKHAKISLGAGNNELSHAGRINRGLFFEGLDGDDSVNIGSDARVGRDAKLKLGEGNNSLSMAGHISRQLILRAGEGDDTVDLLADALVGRNASIRLGAGNNDFSHAGHIGGRLFYQGLEGDDTVEIGVGASVGRDAKLKLGDGNNVLSLAGHLSGDLILRAGEGNDMVDLHADSFVGRNANVRLGDGDNTFSLRGQVNRSLSIRTGDGHDTLSLEESSYIGRNANFRLGDGDDWLTLQGEIQRGLSVHAGAGNDTVEFLHDARTGGSARIRLGNGDDNFVHAGSVGRRLLVNGGQGTDRVFAEPSGTAGQTRLCSIEAVIDPDELE